MNREILFRGKRIDNGEWIYGFYVPIGERNHYILTGKIKIIGVAVGFEHVAVAPETVCQFTGVTDKFDEKVFEGDYVYDEVEEEIGTVKFDEGEFVVCFGDVIDGNCFTDVIASCHVIGNIHDNPELLEGD